MIALGQTVLRIDQELYFANARWVRERVIEEVTCDDGEDRPRCLLFDLRSVIEQFEELPASVRKAQFARIDGRPLDRELFTQLITQPPLPNSEIGWSTRILKREESLQPYLGQILFCVLIRLPGVQYTVEVDPVAKMVVHWEWQPY